VGVDHDLLVTQTEVGLEDVVLLQNGCVCCSVRADLGRVLKQQLGRNQREV
jgi:G3E family GTPase